ncbi:MAG: sulfotransferase domain-containing protein [Hyphomicrobiales bacterium]|nr:sulfotransferase domain-containing protein [Hyphomicrobiales bacterium]MCP5373649.1 sulfotransferase domain-containing protein [Hyphomicrobiales bacterium]
MDDRVFVASLFKSGTWLLRHMVAGLTGLRAIEPPHGHGPADYGDPGLIRFEPGAFFSWHSDISPQVADRLLAERARVVLLVRNVYDLAVSQYHHFARDVDADIGRSAGQADFLARFSRDDGLAMSICGYSAPGASWPGLGPHLAQTARMMAFARDHGALITSYERLVTRKEAELDRLAAFLGGAPDGAARRALLNSSDFAAMKADAEKSGAGSHFRKGQPGQHREVLKPHHVFMVDHLIGEHAPDLRRLAADLRMPEIVQRLG